MKYIKSLYKKIMLMKAKLLMHACAKELCDYCIAQGKLTLPQ